MSLGLMLSRPEPDDAEALFDFERRNRAFYEAHINARPVDYYSLSGVQQAIAAAQAQAARDEAHQFLVRCASGELLGRVNLSQVRRAHFHSAEVGYRVDQAQCGRGVASEALRLLRHEAFAVLGLRRLQASVHEANPASLRVLERNGFVPFGRSRRSFELQGRWLDTHHLECHADA